jgi:hypothetical protein
LLLGRNFRFEDEVQSSLSLPDARDSSKGQNAAYLGEAAEIYGEKKAEAYGYVARG